MAFSSILLSSITCSLIGLAWSFAINASIKNGLLYGAIAGAVLGALMSFISKGVTSRGNVAKKEMSFVSGSLLGILLLLGVGSALIAWIVRALFY